MDKKALVKYLASMLLFGLNGIVADHIPLNSYEIVLLRTCIGSLLLVTLFLLGKGKFHLRAYKRDALFIALSGVAMGASWMCLYEGYQQIGVSLSSLLYYCGPVIVMMLSPLLFREKLTAAKLIGFAVVLVGLFLVNGAVVQNGLNAWGLLCGFLSAVTYFLMVTFNKQSTRITGMENAVIQLITAFITVGIFVGCKQGLLVRMPLEAWGWALLLGLVNTGFGCYLYFSSLATLPAQTVAVCGYLELLSAVVFAALLLNERMTVPQLIGAACILLGAMLGELWRPKKRITKIQKSSIAPTMKS